MNDLNSANQGFQRIISEFKADLAGMRAGRPTPEMFSGLKLSVYGAPSTLAAVGNINVVDATLVTVQVWDKSVVKDVVKALQENNYNPQDDSGLIRIPIPAMTQEKRQELVKQLHEMAEQARIKSRVLRKEVMKHYDQEKSVGMPEDQYNGNLKKLQSEIDKFNQEIDSIAKEKEQALLAI